MSFSVVWVDLDVCCNILKDFIIYSYFFINSCFILMQNFV